MLSTVRELVTEPAEPVVFWLSVPTASTPLVALRPEPASKVARASTVVRCSVEPSLSRVRNESPDAGVTALNSDTSTARVTPPLDPPPERPTPAVTPVISPVLAVKPESLLKADSGISEISFLLSAPSSNRINSSSEEFIA